MAKQWFLEFLQKVANELKGRKFWALATAIFLATQALALGEITHWQFLQAVIAALAAYSTGVAIEGARRS